MLKNRTAVHRSPPLPRARRRHRRACFLLSVSNGSQPPAGCVLRAAAGRAQASRNCGLVSRPLPERTQIKLASRFPAPWVRPTIGPSFVPTAKRFHGSPCAAARVQFCPVACRPNCKALPRQSLCSSSRSVLPCCVSTASQHQRRELRLASVSASEELTRIGSNRHAAYQPTLLQAGRHRCVRYAGAGPCIVL